MARSIKRLAAVLSATAMAMAMASCADTSDGGGGGATTQANAGTIDCEPYKAFGDIKGKQIHVYTSIVAPRTSRTPTRTSRSRPSCSCGSRVAMPPTSPSFPSPAC